jgi:hypothetical protein
MIILALVITIVLFLVILTIGTSRFWRSLLAGAEYWCGENSNEVSARWLKKHIEKAKESVDAVTGNLNPWVYNGVAELVQKRLKESPNLRIRILVGPKVITLEGENKLLAHAEELNEMSEGRFKLAHLDTRPENHFRVVDYSHIYVEQPHPVGAYRRVAEYWENSVFRAWKYHMEFEELWKKRDEAIEPEPIPIEQFAQ